MKKKIIAAVLAVIMSLTLTACSNNSQTSVKNFLNDEGAALYDVDIIDAGFNEYDEYFDYTQDAVKISFSNSEAIVNSDAVLLGNNEITITRAGTYVLKGNYTGTVNIEATENDKVYLVLENVNINSTTGPAIYEKSGDKVILMLPKDTENTLSDAKEYAGYNEDDMPTAALYCKDSLTINGDGKLSVIGNCNDAVTSKAKLKVMSGDYTISAADDGFVGKNLIAVKSGNFDINVMGDALKTTNEQNEKKGNVLIEDGNFVINSTHTAIKSANNLVIKQGTFSITTSGGASSSTNTLGKGLKAKKAIAIGGGSFSFDTGGNSIHSSGTILLSDAQINAATKNDGFHAKTNIVINGGTYKVSQCKEGFEAGTITINAGLVDITSTDDGMNASGKAAASISESFSGGFGSKDEAATSGEDNSDEENNPYLYINGGEIRINAGGDGIDSNGAIEMNGGYVVVSGSTQKKDTSIEYITSFRQNGGTIIATGTKEEYQSISKGSKCYCINYTSESIIPANTKVSLLEGNDELVTFDVIKDADAILIAGDKLSLGDTYTLVIGDKKETVSARPGTDNSINK